jgi:hypothetical protein
LNQSILCSYPQRLRLRKLRTISFDASSRRVYDQGALKRETDRSAEQLSNRSPDEHLSHTLVYPYIYCQAYSILRLIDLFGLFHTPQHPHVSLRLGSTQALVTYLPETVEGYDALMIHTCLASEAVHLVSGKFT